MVEDDASHRIFLHAAILVTLLLATDVVFLVRRFPWWVAALLVFGLGVSVQAMFAPTAVDIIRWGTLLKGCLLGGLFAWRMRLQWGGELPSIRVEPSLAQRALVYLANVVWVLLFPPVVRDSRQLFQHPESPLIILLTAIVVPVVLIELQSTEPVDCHDKQLYVLVRSPLYQYPVTLGTMGIAMNDFVFDTFSRHRSGDIPAIEDLAYTVLSMSAAVAIVSVLVCIVPQCKQK
jgi:hypothetical protein